MDRVFSLNKEELSRERRRRWSLAVGWVLLIYLTLYPVRPVCEFLKAHTPFPVVVGVAMIMILAGIYIGILKNFKMKKISTYLLLFIIFLLYLKGFQLITIPEEKIHFIQYGILAFLFYRAFRCDGGFWQGAGLAFLATSLAGWGDEIIQYYLPNRVYSVKDVFLNIFSGFMAISLICVTERDGDINTIKNDC